MVILPAHSFIAIHSIQRIFTYMITTILGGVKKLAPQLSPTHGKTKLSFLLWHCLKGVKGRAEFIENWKFGLRQVFQCRGI